MVTTGASGFLLDTGLKGDVVALAFPADTRWVRLARLLTSGVAAQAGFDVEEVEDLKIAVDEIWPPRIGRAAAAEQVHLAFRPIDGSVEVVIESAISSGSGDSWT